MIFKAPAVVIWVVCGFWGLFICYGIVSDNFGTIVAIISIVVAPFLLTLAPWYELIASGNWFPLALIYGGGVGASALFAIGATIDKD